jgi:hypothetical protein
MTLPRAAIVRAGFMGGALRVVADIGTYWMDFD